MKMISSPAAILVSLFFSTAALGAPEEVHIALTCKKKDETVTVKGTQKPATDGKILKVNLSMDNSTFDKLIQPRSHFPITPSIDKSSPLVIEGRLQEKPATLTMPLFHGGTVNIEMTKPDFDAAFLKKKSFGKEKADIRWKCALDK